MLAAMRRNVRSPLVLVAIVIIILVFVFWLPQMGGERGPGVVATVNNEALSGLEFQRRYDAILFQYREELGGRVPAELLEALDLRRQVINQMIWEALLLQSAEDTGLPVTAGELQQAIHNMGEFHEDGVFSLERYKSILASLRLSTKTFEADIRRDLLQSKIFDQLASFVTVSDLEIRERFHWDHDEVRLSYLNLSGVDFQPGIQLSEEEIAAHHRDHGDRFRSEPMVRLDYILFNAIDEVVTISAEEVIAHYEANIARYRMPEQRRASHILIRSNPADSAELRQEQRQQAEIVRALAQGGRNFAELARLYSEDVGAGAGGDLGFFQRGEMLEPLEMAAFNLQVGEISQLVETTIGFHIIRLEAIQPGTTITLEQARREIELELHKNKGRQLAFTRAGAVYEKILTTGALIRGAEAAGLVATSTNFFTPNQPPAALRRHPEAVAAASRLNQGELSSIIPTAAGYAILFVQERQEPYIPPLAEIRQQIKTDLISLRAREAARHRAEEILTAIRGGADMRQQVPAGRKVQKSAWFSRTTAAAVDLPAEVRQAALELSKKNPFPTAIQTVNDVFYVIKLDDQRPGEDSLFARWRRPLYQELRQDKQEAIIDTWVNHLAGQADINITPDTLP